LNPAALPSVTDNLRQEFVGSFKSTRNVVDIITFAEDPAYLGERLYPRQKEIFREFYDPTKSWEELLLICGRDSTKTFMASIIACYTAYLWEEIPDPYWLYQGRVSRDKEVSIPCIAKKQEQAGILFDEIKAKISRSPYFKGKTVRINSLDIELTKKLRIEAVTSNSASEVGKTALAVLFDELGKYGTEKGTRDGEEVYDTMKPSVGRFASNRLEFLKRCAGDANLEMIVRFLGRVISITTPMAEQGILWRLFSQWETDKRNQIPTTLLLYKRPTWEMNPNYSFDSSFIKEEMRTNPSFWREWGAEFEKALDAMFKPELIDSCIAKMKAAIDPGMIDYTSAIDTSKTKDAFAFCIGHMLAGRVIIDEIRYWISEDGHRHNWAQIEHDVRLLCMQYRVEQIAHDGFESEGVRLHFHNFLLDETVFTLQYKMDIYDCLEKRLYNHEIEYPGHPRLLAELKALQRKWNGDKFTVHHPAIGPVTNDDGPDVVANVAYRLYNHYVTTREGINDEIRTTDSIEWPDDRRYLDADSMGHLAQRFPSMISSGQDHMEGGE
jgi:hypothetical protein